MDCYEEKNTIYICIYICVYIYIYMNDLMLSDKKNWQKRCICEKANISREIKLTVLVSFSGLEISEVLILKQIFNHYIWN